MLLIVYKCNSLLHNEKAMVYKDKRSPQHSYTTLKWQIQCYVILFIGEKITLYKHPKKKIKVDASYLKEEATVNGVVWNRRPIISQSSPHNNMNNLLVLIISRLSSLSTCSEPHSPSLRWRSSSDPIPGGSWQASRRPATESRREPLPRRPGADVDLSRGGHTGEAGPTAGRRGLGGHGQTELA